MKTRAYQSKIRRVLALPMRVLSKARDTYVKSMNSYADRTCYGDGGAVAAWGPTMGDELPRSFSTTKYWCDDHDLRQLARLEVSGRKCSTAGVVPRSSSCVIGMATIEEDRVCECGGDVDWGLKTMKMKKRRSRVGGGGILFPRSRTCATASTRPGVVWVS